MNKTILVGLLFLLAGCVEVETPLIMEDGDVLPNNICSKLDKVIVIEKTGCPACTIALPRLEELEKENNWKFDYYNIAVEEERNKLLSLGFVSRYVPTLIADCKIYSGVLEKEKYKEIIEKWLTA